MIAHFGHRYELKIVYRILQKIKLLQFITFYIILQLPNQNILNYLVTQRHYLQFFQEKLITKQHNHYLIFQKSMFIDLSHRLRHPYPNINSSTNCLNCQILFSLKNLISQIQNLRFNLLMTKKPTKKQNNFNYLKFNNFMDEQIKLNDPQHVGFIINFTIAQIMNQVNQSLKEKQLLTHQNEFVHFNFMNIIDQFIFQSTPNFPVEKPNSLSQQSCSQIVKIQKDNLSPKQLPSQYNQKQTVKNLPQILSQVGSKRLNLTNRSSFLKRKSSIISQVSSSMIASQRKPNQNKSVNKQSNIRKSTSLKKDPLQNFTSLIVPEQEDEQIKRLREVAEFHYKEKQKQIKLINARLNQDKQKVQSFKAKYGQSQQYTFDFQGQTLEAEISKQQKLNYNAMKYGMRTLSKKFKEMYKNVQQGKNNDQKGQAISTRSNSKIQKQNDKNGLDLNASFQIPTFQRQLKTFIPQTDPSKLKIKQFKRLYARKFSRYDNHSMTLDVNTLIDKKVAEQDYFSSKKHFKDSTTLNKSRQTSHSKQYTQKLLTLPRLQGKYKVLDRYQQL